MALWHDTANRTIQIQLFVDHTVDITTQTIVCLGLECLRLSTSISAGARRLFAPWDFNVYRHRLIRSVQNFLRQNRPHSSRVRHRPECHILFRSNPMIHMGG